VTKKSHSTTRFQPSRLRGVDLPGCRSQRAPPELPRCNSRGRPYRTSVGDRIVLLDLADYQPRRAHGSSPVHSEGVPGATGKNSRRSLSRRKGRSRADVPPNTAARSPSAIPAPASALSTYHISVLPGGCTWTESRSVVKMNLTRMSSAGNHTSPIGELVSGNHGASFRLPHTFSTRSVRDAPAARSLEKRFDETLDTVEAALQLLHRRGVGDADAVRFRTPHPAPPPRGPSATVARRMTSRN
jgi:hypothetical protein